MRSRWLVLLTFLAACGSTDAGVSDAGGDEGARDGGLPDGGGALAGFVVDVAWLAENLNDAELRIQPIDTRPSGFETSRIPGAIRLDPLELSATVDGIQAQVAPKEQADAIFSAAGLERGSIAVVYGQNPEYDPARIFWVLEYHGHDSDGQVLYLDGGWSAWLAAGESVETGEPTAAPTVYASLAPNDAIRVTGDFILGQLGDPPYDAVPIEIVDARSPGEFSDGHIPTAVHIQWSTNLEAGYLKPAGELADLHAQIDRSSPVIVYCLAGWRASLGWLALRALGYEDVRVYDGSWLEWGVRDDVPIIVP